LAGTPHPCRRSSRPASRAIRTTIMRHCHSSSCMKNISAETIPSQLLLTEHEPTHHFTPMRVKQALATLPLMLSHYPRIYSSPVWPSMRLHHPPMAPCAFDLPQGRCAGWNPHPAALARSLHRAACTPPPAVRARSKAGALQRCSALSHRSRECSTLGAPSRSTPRSARRR
jgi:hypothetical protein